MNKKMQEVEAEIRAAVAAANAVTMLKRMHARAVHSENRGDVPRIGSDEVLAVLRATQAERARHAEEVARWRDVHRGETREGGE